MKERCRGGVSHPPPLGARLLHTLKTSNEAESWVLDGCLCEGGAALCLSVSDQTIRAYDTRTGAPIRTMSGHTRAIKDVTAAPSTPQMLYSAQEDTGVMVSDLRAASAVCFLAEFCESGAVGGTVGVSTDGKLLGVAVNGDVHLVDVRTWQSVHVIANMHLDEIARLRFLSETVYCSAGEDQMVNFIDAAPNVVENDMLLQAITCGEVITKMTAFPELGALGLVGSCENAYVCPFDLEQHEVRLPRADFSTYLVDFCVLAGQLHLLTGVRDAEGNAGPLRMMNWETRQFASLPPLHTELCRIAIGHGDRLITGGEDNVVAFWSLDSTPASASGVATQRHAVRRPLQSKPYTK